MLKSVLQTPRFILAFKALLLTLFFVFVFSPDVGFFWLLVFFLIALFFYFRSSFNHAAFASSFVTLLALLPLLAPLIDVWSPFFLIPLYFAWFTLFGLQDFLFPERRWWQYVLFVLLLYGAIAWYVFRLDVGGGMLFATSVFVALLSLLLNELWGAQLPNVLLFRKRLALIATFLLLLLQGIWVLRLLPLSTQLIVLIAFFASALVAECVVYFYSISHFSSFFLRRCALFFGFLAFVFLTSRWLL